MFGLRQTPFMPYQWKNRIMIKFLDSNYWWNTPGSVGGGRTIYNKTGDKIISTHLRENIELNANTQFQSLIDLVPLGRSLAGINEAFGGLTGHALGGVGRFFEVQTWKSTDPLSFTLTLHFDTDTSSERDVFLPSIALQAYTVPQEEEGKTLLKVPGPNIYTLLKSGQKQKSAEDYGLSTNSNDRLVSVLIGGWLYFNELVLIKADPTFSKELTESGYPLWSEINMEVKTLKTTTVDSLVGMAEDAQQNSQTLYGAIPSI